MRGIKILHLGSGELFKIHCFRRGYQNSSFGKWGVIQNSFFLDGAIKILHLESGGLFKIHCFRQGYKSSSFGNWGVCMVFKINGFRRAIKILQLGSGELFKIHCFRQGVSKFFIWKVGSLYDTCIQNSLF